uniref:Uncharacterized protein n=1 Tax=Rhizophora mucronata TaxID=61149 RepID=A0A2P2ISG8_RHIMU
MHSHFLIHSNEFIVVHNKRLSYNQRIQASIRVKSIFQYIYITNVIYLPEASQEVDEEMEQIILLIKQIPSD